MLTILRVVVLSVFVAAGYYFGRVYGRGYETAFVGILAGVTVLLISEFLMRYVRLGRVMGAIAGLFSGLVLANLLAYPLRDFIAATPPAYFVIYAVFGYTGLFIGLSKGEGLTIAAVLRLFKGQGVDENLKILDTSAIIDGRIADVCNTGFLDGVFLVPQFMLHELQHIADSSDSMKRSRGRRGLDILHRIQKLSGITVRIIDEDFPKLREVDAKLVALARSKNASIITTDFNLNKVAQLQDVKVLNINDLANSLKPLVLPGEAMKVFIVKEGKEINQGVAYTDDGTMVVVENARKLIGKNVEVVVTSVLQTTAGRMIFSKPGD
jgi:uncharacterized protein YacL